MRTFAALCAISLASTPAASADGLSSMSLEDLLRVEVTGASRYVQPLSEAPSAVSVVAAEDIRRFGFRTLAEALQSVRGVYATNDRAYSYLGIRGFGRPGDYNSRILLLVDGNRRNDAIYDQAMVGHEGPVEMDWVKRVEFVPGPSSAIYGGNALFGIVNAVLWSGADLDGSRVTAEAGSAGMARLGLLAGRGIEAGGQAGDWIAGVSVYRKRGGNLHFPEFDGVGGSDGVARGLDGERHAKAFAKLNLGGWHASVALSSRHKDVPTAYFSTDFNAPGNFTLDQHAYADIGHAATLSENLTRNVRLHAGAYRYDGEYAFLSSSGVVGRDEARAKWWGAEYRLTWTGMQGHTLLLGAEAQRNGRVDQRYFDISPRTDYLDSRHRGSGAGLFVQDEWRFAPRWMANLGLRADRIADFGATLSPRAALIHHPVPEASVKLIHGRAFRPPNAYERFYHDGGSTQKASTDLKPERIATTELAADMAVTPTLRLGASLYRYRMKNLVEQITDPADSLLVFVNQPPIRARGAELEAEAMLAGGWRLRGSFAAQQIRQDSGAESANSPRRLAKLLADGPLFDTGWTFGLNLQAIGSRLSANGSRVPAYVAGNLMLRRGKAAKGGEWSVGLYNLSGHRHLDPSSSEHVQNALPQDGRQLQARWEIVL
ncbi:MAG: TonB-dependent receptor [Candidatus Nitricoxidivorans perseverans]|uniref:TonB-dependent receptor n=1 Tax=Candidatus Nitricoxidivorans perseverans TaxID=2975601 RepID=A0AA49FKU2_9PROT|nr:MAG: TonB-dependent receptor [Candidatus Nitricoxidivorans perseverans]